MNETLYGIQYNTIAGTPQAIGTITEDTYKMLYDGSISQTTEFNKDQNWLHKTLTTDNYDVFKLARELHRKSLEKHICQK